MSLMKHQGQNKLLGVVMCGGESKRMGRDKGSLLKDGKTWAMHITEKLSSAGLEVVISVNAGQLDQYRSIFPHHTLVVDDVPVGGPLQGLLSVHEQFPDQDLLLMACDLLEMDQYTLGQLIAAHQTKHSYQFYVYRHQGFTEPFCAVYTAKALSGISGLLEKGELKRFSLHERFEQGNTLYLDVADVSVFKNYNYSL
jgi:molybdopterin-guanine dinucleotide biosynthesis protein A